MTYKNSRGYFNVQYGTFKKVGKYEIPQIKPFTKKYEPCQFIGFNYAMQEKNPENKGLHFYLDDYQFERLWNKPSKYTNILKQFKYVLAPDFSLYTDIPTALNIYNHYRKHWLATYYQQNGVNIIPTICWSDKNSFKWCFDGEPQNSIITVSSIGVCQTNETIENFRQGYMEMEKRLNPKEVWFFGKPIFENWDCDKSKILLLETDQQKRLKKLQKRADKNGRQRRFEWNFGEF